MTTPGMPGLLATAWAALLGLSGLAHAGPVTYELGFTTSGQSIWDTGESFRLNETKFIGAQWQNKTTGIDLIAGDETTNVINPLRVTYDAALATCRLAFSSSTCINGQSARVPVPALGSRPSVRSCGTFNFSCHTKAAADLVKRTAYDAAFATCRLGFSASVCRNGQSGQVPVPALGTAPAQFLEVDTRTGVAVEATSDGRIGLELGIEIDSGSVDATVSYLAELDIPDTLGLDRSNPINFNASSLLSGENSLDTSFASIELSVDAIMELSGHVGGEACAIGAGCISDGTPFGISERAPILSFNEGGEGGILVLGETPSDLGIPNFDGLPYDVNIADLATLTLHLPQPAASGGLDAGTQTLKASDADDFLDLFLDLDNIVATAAGVPGLFGSSVDIGPGSVGFDIIDVQAGPTIDLTQDFELDPTLFVNLIFDTPVLVGGVQVSELISAWDLLPDITFLSDITTVTPTFFLDAMLFNQTGLDFDLEFMVNLLQINYDFGLLGADTFGIGNVLSQGADLFETPALYSKLFNLGGFDLQIGQSFVVDFLGGSSGPSSPLALSARDTILVFDPDALPVPEPNTLLLLLGGFLMLVGLRSRPRG